VKRISFFFWSKSKTIVVSYNNDLKGKLVQFLKLDESFGRKAYPTWKVYVVEILTEQQSTRSILLQCSCRAAVCMMYVGQRFSHPFTCSGPSVHHLKEVCCYIAVCQCIFVQYLKTCLKKRTNGRKHVGFCISTRKLFKLFFFVLYCFLSIIYYNIQMC